MAAVKGSHADADHYAASEANSPEPSVRPEPISDASGYPEINPSSMELLHPDKNPSIVGPLARNSLTVSKRFLSRRTQHWWKCREAAMEEGDLEVCLVLYMPNQQARPTGNRTMK